MGIDKSAGNWLRSRRWIAAAVAACAALGASAPAYANVNGPWTAGGTTTVNGVTVTVSGSAVTGGAVETLNATNFWTNPYTGGTPNGVANGGFRFTVPAAGGSMTIVFGKPVDNLSITHKCIDLLRRCGAKFLESLESVVIPCRAPDSKSRVLDGGEKQKIGVGWASFEGWSRGH